jgi:glutathione S-transferase
MSNLEVFWGSGSQPSWRVLLALEVKRLPYKSHLLSFSAGEHKTPEFLRLNPRHRVPVLRDGDYVVNESVAILAYLDRKYPEVPLFGRTPEETGLIWRTVQEFTHYLEPALVEGVVRPIFRNQVDARESIEAKSKEVHGELQVYEARLAEQPWLVGSALSAADIVVFPQLMGLLRAATRPAAEGMKLELLPFAEKYPRLAAWVGRIEALPGYENTYPPHWRQV